MGTDSESRSLSKHKRVKTSEDGHDVLSGSVVEDQELETAVLIIGICLMICGTIWRLAWTGVKEKVRRGCHAKMDVTHLSLEFSSLPMHLDCEVHERRR